MPIIPRPYQSPADLLEIGQLIRRTFTNAPYWNSWSFARYDIWAQRQISNETILGRLDWQPDIQLWSGDEDHLVAGAVWFESSNQAALAAEPENPKLVETMLVWAETHFQERRPIENPLQRPLRVEALEGNAFMEELLRDRGYEKPDAHMVLREKPLVDTPAENYTLPPGYSIRALHCDEDIEIFVKAVAEVFNTLDTPDIYKMVCQAPSYNPNLDLMVLSEQEEVAAFCTLWVDPEHSIAQFEPVGTVPAFQRRGLGRAILCEGFNRLRALEIQTATVHCWSESVAANNLYEAAGLLPREKMFNWSKTWE